MAAACACEHLQALRRSVPSLGPLARAVCAEQRRAPCGADVVCLACGAARDRAAAQQHAADEGAGHAIGVDVARAELFCGACGDFVYDASFDRAVAGSRARAPGDGGDASLPQASGAWAGHKRKARTWGSLAEPLAPGAPAEGGGAEAAGSFGGGAAPAPPPACAPLPELSPPLGLRGLNNLGNTCFIASVLQSVLCLPPLKAHYLSGGHAAGACAARRRARGAAAAAAPCLGCELDAAFGRAFAPPPRGSPAGAPRAPWSPAALLAAWWRSAEALASYQQQDAHEFFLSLVEAVHTATSAQDRERRPTTPAAALLRSPSCGLGSPRAGFGAGAAGCDADCGCAMHRAFGGLLRSDVVCAGCGGCSTALDPFVDVSLELDSAGAAASSQALTLGACLRRFTRPERLGGGARVLACAACGSGPQAGTKQLSFAAAPPALCLHLKRFAHGARIAPHGAGAGGGSGGSGNGTSAAGGASGTGGNAEASKLDFHVSFPLDDLDLGPFLAPARLRARAGHRVSAETAPASSSKCLYWLAAAVCHVGSLEGGHYVAYARHGGAWFRCDDSWVTAVPAAEVAAAQAYLLFYASHAVTSTHPPGGA